MSSPTLWINRLLLTLALGLMFLHTANAGTLSCSVATTCAAGTVIWRMQNTTNAHAELPSQALYTQLVCCSGVTGLGTSCAGTFATVLKLSGTTNAHVQQNTQTPYANNACMSVTAGGTVSVGYQATNCVGFDTTLGSMSAVTNAHVGNSAAYPSIQICGTATAGAAQSLTFSISANSIGFGTLSTAVPRFANTTGGSATEVEAHTLTASTNATGGYIITVQGATLTSGGNTITAIGGTNTVSAPGTEQFGLRATVTSGTGTVTAPYAAAGFAYAATASTASQVASGAGDGASTIYSARYIGNIAGSTEAGSYSAALTYIATATF